MRGRAGGRGADRGQRWPGWGLAGLLAHLAARWRGYAVDETLDMVLPGANREAQRPGRLFEQCAAVLGEGVGLCDHPRRERLGEINRGEELGCKIGLKLGDTIARLRNSKHAQQNMDMDHAAMEMADPS